MSFFERKPDEDLRTQKPGQEFPLSRPFSVSLGHVDLFLMNRPESPERSFPSKNNPLIPTECFALQTKNVKWDTERAVSLMRKNSPSLQLGLEKMQKRGLTART